MRATEPATARLRLRGLEQADAEFLVGLYNQPDFLQFIGDRGIRSVDDARAWLANVTHPLYAAGRGLGMRGIAVPALGGRLVGICGLLQRAHLPYPDLGYALQSGQGGQGFAREAAAAMLTYAFGVLAYPRVLAVLDSANTRSVRVLERLGMRPIGTTRHPGEVKDLALYAADARAG